MSYPGAILDFTSQIENTLDGEQFEISFLPSCPSVYYDKSIDLLLQSGLAGLFHILFGLKTQTLSDMDISKNMLYACKRVFDRMLGHWASVWSGEAIVEAISALARDGLQEKDQNSEGDADLEKLHEKSEVLDGELLERVTQFLAEEIQSPSPYTYLKKIEQFGDEFAEEISSVIDYSLLLGELAGLSAQNIFLGCSTYYFLSRNLSVSVNSEVVAGIVKAITKAYQADLEGLQ